MNGSVMLRPATTMMLAVMAGGVAQGAGQGATPAMAAGAAAYAKEPHHFLQTVEGHDLQGIWIVENYVATVRPVEDRVLKTIAGEAPPLQDWAQEIYDRRITDDRKGLPFASTSARCLPGGMPLMMRTAAYPIQILQTPGQVTMLHEEMTVYRHIQLGGVHPEDPDPSYMGDSIGHWEGDTLVVDTVGLKTITTLDPVGLPHTEQLHVVERIRRTGPKQIENVLTLDDPGAFTRPWSLRLTYALQPPQRKLAEYICENQRNAPVGEHPGFQR